MTDNADSGHYHRSPAKKSKMFQPDPPIERQVQQIEQYFQDLIKCINDEIQTTRDYSYDADNSPRKSLKNRKKSSNSATIDAINYNLKEDIHKLFCDAWRFLRQGQKFDIGDQVQDMKSLFIQEFNDIKIYMQNLRNEQLNLLRDTVEIKGMKLKDSIIFNISNLMNDLIESLYADLLEIWLKSLDYNDHEFASSIFSSLLDNLADFSIGLNNFHFDIIRNVESLSRPIHETVIFMDTPDYIEATTQQLKDQKLCEFFEDYLNDTLVEFQEAANISHSMNQKITEFYNQMFEKLKVVDPTADQFDAELAFHSRVDNHSNICNIYSVFPTSVRNPPITKKFPIENPENDFDNYENDSEENEDYDDDNNQEESHNQKLNNKGANLENLWEKTRFQKYSEFVTSELSYTSNVLQEDLLSFWHDVHSSKLPYHSLAIGQMLYNVLDNRFTHFDKSLKPTEISEPFYLSVLYNDDDDLSYDYEELLESIVE